MRRVRYGVAASLDGFIAGPDGQADWILMDPAIDFAALFSQFDTLLIGRRTYAAMGKGGQGSMRDVKSIVFSTTLRQEEHPRVTIVNRDAGEAVAALRREPGKDIALFGGGGLFRSLLDAGQVDTVEVALIPVLLGAGIPLLPPPYGPVPLTLTSHRALEATGTLMLEYAIGRETKRKVKRTRV